MLFFNHNSFVLLGIFIWSVVLMALRQRGWQPISWLVLVAVTVILVISYFSLRPSAASSDPPEEIRSQIGQGMPVLLEFQSQN